MSIRHETISSSPRGDGFVIAALAAVIGAIRVAIAVGAGQSFGAESTIGLAMLVLGCVGIVAGLRGR